MCFKAESAFRILAVHRYYWPDTSPYATMLRRIVWQWSKDGHQVEVLSSQPSYKRALRNERQARVEIVDHAVVRRLSLPNESGKPFTRVINGLRLCFVLFWKAITQRYDVIMISTSPPIIGGLTAAIVANITGARFVYHCMDIHPEVGAISGEFSNPLIFRWLKRLDQWSCRIANPVVVLSEDMEHALRRRFGGDRLKIAIINNFSLPEYDEIPEELPFEWSSDRFTILFAGNIGRFQGLDVVIDAMDKLKDYNEIEFIFMGEGAAKEGLQERAHALGVNVRFISHQPIAIAKAVMKQVDIGFVSLLQNVYKYAFPSKTMTYLEQSCPLIVSVEPESKLAHDVIADGYGFTVVPGDSMGLAALILKIWKDQNWKPDMKRSAFYRAGDEFSEAVVLSKWSTLLD